jgi:hypothetical protein
MPAPPRGEHLDPQNMDGILISVMSPAAFAAMNSSQLEGLSTDSCSYVTRAQITAINTTEFGSLAHCMPSLYPDAVSAITADQVEILSPEQVKSVLVGSVIQHLSQAAFSALQLDQVIQLGAEARLMLNGEKYIWLFRRWSKELLVDPTGWTPHSFSIIYHKDTILEVKKAVASGSLKPVVPIPASCRLGFTSWAHLAMMTGSPPDGWNSDFMACIGENAIAGFMPAQTAAMTIDGVLRITKALAARLLEDTLAAFNKEQWGAFSADSLSEIDPRQWSSLNCTDCFSMFKAVQIRTIRWFSAPCVPVGGMQESQFEWVEEPVVERYEARRRECGLAPLNRLK